MMKLFLGLLLFSINTLACSPPFFKPCEKPEVIVDTKAYDKMLQAVYDYNQSLVEAVINKPDHPCLNHSISVMEAQFFQSEFKRHNGLACKKDIEQLQKSLTHFLSEDRDEFKATDPKQRPLLRSKAKKLREMMNHFFKKH